MSMFKGFILGSITGAVLAMLALRYHVVHTNEGLILVGRTQTAPLRSSYVDVRRWSVTMWQQYPEVTSALTKAGRGDLLLEGAVNSVLPDRAISVPEPQVPTAQTASDVVPIRFMDSLGDLLPGQSSTPASVNPPAAAPEAIPWEEFLKRATQPAGTNPAPSTSSTIPAGSSLPVNAVSSPGNAVSDLLRSATESRSLNSMANSVGTNLESQVQGVTSDLLSQWASPSTATPLPINPHSAAPQREWVQNVLQSMIPDSSIPAAVDRSALTPTQLSAPAPGISGQGGTTPHLQITVPQPVSAF